MNKLQNMCLSGLICLTFLASCDDTEKIKPTFTQTYIPSDMQIDMGKDVEKDIPKVINTFCEPNTRRCIGVNSPVYEQCSTTGKSFRTEICADGQMCRDGQCTQFSCFPGRSLCVGTDATALCSPTGQEIEPPTPCPDNQSCRAGFCVDLCEEAKQDQSYIGCEYLAHDLFNYYRLGRGELTKSPYAIVVANTLPLTETTVNLTDIGLQKPATLIKSIKLTADNGYKGGTSTTVKSAILKGTRTLSTLGSTAENIKIPPSSAAVLLIETQKGLPNAFMLKSSHPVVAYQFSPYCCNFTATNDASLLIPTATLQSTYRVLGYPSWNDQSVGPNGTHPYIYMIATQDNTRIKVTSPTPVVEGLHDLGGTLGNPDKSWTGTLDAGETKILSAAESGDLSGALIEASGPISVFSGHPCTFVPSGEAACDHLEEQLFPASILGKKYLLQNMKLRNPNFTSPGEQVYWRIVAHEDSVIKFEPDLDDVIAQGPSNMLSPSCLDLFKNNTLKLKAGESCEFGTREFMAIESTGALIVGGVLSGHISTQLDNFGQHAGDPALFLVPPVEQFRRDYTFVAPPTFEKTYANIVVPDGVHVALNGVQIASSKQLQRSTVKLDAVKWRVYSVRLTPGVHRLRSDSAFGLIVYAYDDFVSYAFPGGLDLRPKIKE